MRIRFHVDPDTGLPHIYGHGVREDEVEDVLDGIPTELVPAVRELIAGHEASGKT